MMVLALVSPTENEVVDFPAKFFWSTYCFALGVGVQDGLTHGLIWGLTCCSGEDSWTSISATCSTCELASVSFSAVLCMQRAASVKQSVPERISFGVCTFDLSTLTFPRSSSSLLLCF